MFERFTDEAIRAIGLASREADRLGSDYIGTEHLLLGLLEHDQGIVHRVFASLRITFGEIDAALVEEVGAGDVAARHHPYTVAAKEALEESFLAALRLGATHVHPEHILLALVERGRDDDAQAGLAGMLLLKVGVRLEAVRRATLEEIRDNAHYV